MDNIYALVIHEGSWEFHIARHFLDTQNLSLKGPFIKDFTEKWPF